MKNFLQVFMKGLRKTGNTMPGTLEDGVLIPY